MKKGKDLETDYFLQEEGMKKKMRAGDQEKERHKLDSEALKQLHYMKCSLCGQDLQKQRMSYVDVFQCGQCGAVVIARGDIDAFVTEEKSVLKSLINFFK